ncbi:MAG: hypothetical protein ACE5KE_03885 [Methanosarcinales archaeon]
MIPFYHKDIRLTIDPALIEFYDKELYRKITDFMEYVIELIKDNESRKARGLINFPEVNEIRLGYSEVDNYGKGNGDEYNERIFGRICKNLEIFDRKEKRIEALYWLIEGLAHDRLSDIIANILKDYLIKYTQQRSKTHNIPMERVTIKNIFDFNKKIWIDEKVFLPLNQHPAFRDQGILFVPKNFLRTLPYFNFEGLKRLCRRAIRESEKRTKKTERKYTKKAEAIAIIQERPEYIDKYIKKKKSLKYQERYPLTPYDVDNDPKGLLKDC